MAIEVGILGLGHIGYYHIRALQDLPEYQLKAACDLNPELEKNLPDDVTFYHASDDFFSDDIYDTVVITTPNDTHYHLGWEALEAGKHIIMEKPATNSIEELITLEERSKKKGLHIYHAFHAAKGFEMAWFRNYYNQEKNRNTLGPITGFSSTFYDPYIQDDLIKSEAHSLQNPWVDSGVNAISVLSEIMDIESLSPFVSSKPQFNITGNFIRARVHFSFAIEGIGHTGIGIIDTDWSLGINQKKTHLFFAFSGNCIELDHTNQKVILISPDNQYRLLKNFEKKGDRLYNHYIGVFSDYSECLKNNTFNNETAKKIYTVLFFANQGVSNQ